MDRAALADDGPDALRIIALRAEIGHLSAALHQLRRAGLDSATTQLMLSRKCAALDELMTCRITGTSPKADPAA